MRRTNAPSSPADNRAAGLAFQRVIAQPIKEEAGDYEGDFNGGAHQRLPLLIRPSARARMLIPSQLEITALATIAAVVMWIVSG
jgi:hypothetical protein